MRFVPEYSSSRKKSTGMKGVSRILFLAFLCGILAGCTGTGTPSPDPFIGRWELEGTGGWFFYEFHENGTFSIGDFINGTWEKENGTQDRYMLDDGHAGSPYPCTYYPQNGLITCAHDDSNLTLIKR